MATNNITKVLIANRGEIARRIQRAAKELGIKTVTVASEADAKSLFVREAEEIRIIGPAPAKDSYLSIEKIIKAARETNCNAVHPGYGFLSENAEFAQAVETAGMIFIGPSAEAIGILGSKTRARERVSQFGVPCTPGTPSGLSDEELLAQIQEIGFPVIIKAVAGGGGRGMRIINSVEELKENLPRARAEALKNFSSGDVYAEKYVERPRHVEVQIFGDAHGNVLHFGTRDCSTQRRHQKLVEEAPAPNLPQDLREQIHQAAVNAGKSVNYQNAGTVEFLVSGSAFYFLEVNTRIQVEHPVTEAVTGVDLVKLQFEVANGNPIPFKQEDVHIKGHAFEYRIYAEDPGANFRPSVGCVTELVTPEAENVRVDSALASGDEISPYYDATICKLIVFGDTRRAALRLSQSYLRTCRIEGLPSTLPFHRWLLLNKDFRERPVDIGYVERTFDNEALKLLAAADTRDPLHKVGEHGAAVVEIRQYSSRAFSEPCLVEIIHETDGNFLFTPVSARGDRARNRYCRRSNGLSAGMQALINEVLERVPPPDLFPGA